MTSFTTQPVNNGTTYKITDTTPDHAGGNKRLTVKSAYNKTVLFDRFLGETELEVTIPIDSTWTTSTAIAVVSVTLNEDAGELQRFYYLPASLNKDITQNL